MTQTNRTGTIHTNNGGRITGAISNPQVGCFYVVPAGTTTPIVIDSLRVSRITWE